MINTALLTLNSSRLDSSLLGSTKRLNQMLKITSQLLFYIAGAQGSLKFGTFEVLVLCVFVEFCIIIS